MKKINPSLIGLAQALGLVIYCALIAGLLWFLGNISVEPLGFFGSVLMLMLLVFSAAVTGSIVFGYPTYLVLNNRVKEALSILAFTLLYCLGVIIVVIVITAMLG